MTVERRDKALLAGGLLLAFILLGGPRAYPLVDDWAYAFTVRALRETGRLRLSDWTSPTLLAQALWGLLWCAAGFSYRALHASTMALACAAVCLFYDLLREGGVERRSALLASATLAAHPVFLNLSVTFMTEIPFLAAALLALRVYQRRGAGWAAGAAFALASLVRQPGLLLAAGCALHARKRGKRGLTALILPSAVVLAGYSSWLREAHGVTWAQRMYVELGTLLHVLNAKGFLVACFQRSGWLALLSGLAALPLALPAARPPRRWWGWALLAVAVLSAPYFMQERDNVLWQRGVGMLFARARSLKPAGPLEHPAFWALCGGALLLAFTGLAGAAEASLSPAAALLLFAFAPMLAWLMVGQLFADRYALPFALPALALAAALPARRSCWLVWAGLAAFSLAGNADWLACHDAFQRGEALAVARGVPAELVESTAENIAERHYQANMDALKKTQPLEKIDDNDWLVPFREQRRATVSFAPVTPDGYEPLGEESYFSALTLRRERVFVYGKKSITR